MALTGEPTWPKVLAAFTSEYSNRNTVERWTGYLTDLARANGWNHPHQMTAAGIAQWTTQPRRDGKPAANNTVRTRMSAVRSFLGYCEREGIPAPNVEHALRRLRKAYPRLLGKRQGQYEPRRLTASELDRLFVAASNGTWLGSRNQLALRLLALGLRRDEVENLRWGDVKRDGHIERLGKMNRLREAFPGERTIDMVARWRRFYVQHVGPASPDAPLFASSGGNGFPWHAGIHGSTLYKIVKDAADTAGLGRVSPHDLRRSLARIMDDAGYRLQDIQSALGHADTSAAVTQACYIGPLHNEAKLAAGKLID